MAQVATVGVEYLGGVPVFADGTPAFSSFTLDADTDAVSVVLQAWHGVTIDTVLFRTGGTVTVGGNVDVRIETVSGTNGLPTGTLFGTNTYARINATATNTVYTGSLVGNLTLARGDRFAIVIQREAGTTVNLTVAGLNLDTTKTLLPATYVNATGAYALNTDAPIAGLRTSGGAWIYLHDTVLPLDTLASAAFNSGSSTNRRGAYVTLPTPRTVTGICVRAALAAGADFVVKVAPAATTDPSSMTTVASLDGDNVTATTGNWLYIPFSTAQVFDAGAAYRIVLEPSTANNVTLYEFTVAAAAQMDAFAGGQNLHHTSYTTSTWTETTTRRPWMVLMFSGSGDDSSGTTVTNVIADTTQFGAQALKQSEATAARRRVYFTAVDATDGAAETGLTFSAGDVKLSKSGGSEANHAGSFTHLGGGLYYYEPTTGEVDTLGVLTLRMAKTGVAAFTLLVPIVAYDPFDVIRMGMTALPSDAITTGAVASDGSNSATSFKTNLSSSATDAYVGQFLSMTSGTYVDQGALVAAYDGTTKFITLDRALSGIPSAADTFRFVDR